MPRPKLPRKIKVGAHMYTVTRVGKEQLQNAQSEMGYDLAQADTDNLRIKILKGTPFSRLQETIFHELKHACLADTPVSVTKLENSSDYEEVFIRALSPPLLVVLQDNPEFVAWLCYKGDK